ncbi:Endoplasmic reticulum oxidoreductin-2 [Nosema granulosis]|uniref:Endoplasmic reticulum oxidoreductin-2 n=1 Tax=Nosema granulosis TaxID=83296 RepID=A0A9P6H1J7_9MICR|nr:Endoplasmic reticulum oxidoreductin-2 [Nosema granulosis]
MNLLFYSLMLLSSTEHLTNNVEFNILETNIMKYKMFREIKTRTKFCKEQTKCTLRSCSSSSFLRNGYVSIQNLKETYTGYNGRFVWKKLYKICENEKDLLDFVSGIHFSVTVHIARNYSRLLRWYLPNPKLFRRKHKSKYERNFQKLLKFVKSAVFNKKSVKVTACCKKRCLCRQKGGSIISRKCFKEFGFFVFHRLLLERTLQKDQTLQKGIFVRGGGLIKKIKKILSLIDCLECDKCKILGNLQFEGLKEACREKISKEGFVYLVLFYRKLCQTSLDVEYLRSLENWIGYHFVDYADYLIYLILIFLFIKTILFVRKLCKL